MNFYEGFMHKTRYISCLMGLKIIHISNEGKYGKNLQMLYLLPLTSYIYYVLSTYNIYGKSIGIHFFFLLEIMLNSLTLQYICTIYWRKPKQLKLLWKILGQMCLSSSQHVKQDLETKIFIWFFLHLLKANVKNTVLKNLYSLCGIYWAQIQRMLN